MAKFTGYEKGLGIGGWLTNYKRFNVIPEDMRFDITIGDEEHFKTYITKSDIQYIASLGFDHIRLGFDQIVLEQKPYEYREYIFEILESFVSWCKQYNLNIIFNLHKAIGNYCDIPEKTSLLGDEELQQRFISLWCEIEKRFHSEDRIVFELLNEVRDVPPEQWNTLAEKTINELRRLNPTRKIMIGGTCWNSPDTLKYLKLFDDKNIVYTFHFYEPFEFTHQMGVLQSMPLYYNRKMEYPAPISKYMEYKKLIKADTSEYDNFEMMDKNTLEYLLRGAIEFVSEHKDCIVTCGEFGTIRHCNTQYRLNWTRDVVSILNKYEISYCAWNYLSTPNDGNRFSIVDDETRKLIDIRYKKILIGDTE